MNLLPKVFRTEGDMVEFDPSKILNSIIAETGMEEEKAKHITELVVRRIISSGIQFLSGPHIREIVCSILSENRYEKERKLYTRIGMPLMDYEEILEFGLKKGDTKILNPEKIHHWAANQLAEEYTLLRILNDEESEAHLYGDIYIHQLKYFDLRPYSQIWDPRIILKNGLPPITNLNNYYKSAPPTDLDEAIFQLANWFGIIQSEFCGSQVYDFLNIFLAPYAQRLDYKKVKYAIETYIHHINYISLILSKGFLKSSVYSSPIIIDTLKNLPAVGPKGEIVGVYGDFQEGAQKVLKALIDAFLQADHNGTNHKGPLHTIYFQADWLTSQKNLFEKLYNYINSNYNPILVNTATEFYNLKLGLIDANKYFNNGILQKISINLPRIAYIATNEDKFQEILGEKLELCFRILKKKRDIIQKRLNTNHLPFCSAKIGDQLLYNFDLQELCVGFVGLNEAVKMLTNLELHESDESFYFGEKIVIQMSNYCEERSKKEGINYSLIEDLSNTATRRFVKLDLTHFPKIPILRNKEGLKEFLYTNSSHFKKDSCLTIKELLKKQSKFHSLIKNGSHEEINLRREKSGKISVEEFLDILEFVNSDTKINKIKFYLQ